MVPPCVSHGGTGLITSAFKRLELATSSSEASGEGPSLYLGGFWNVSGGVFGKVLHTLGLFLRLSLISQKMLAEPEEMLGDVYLRSTEHVLGDFICIHVLHTSHRS